MTAVWLAVTAEGERSVRICNRLIVLVDRGRRIAASLNKSAGARYLEDLNEAGLVRAWAAMDSYLTDRADVLTRREMPVPKKPSKVMVEAHMQVLRSTRGSFERLQGYWKDPLGVKFSDYADWGRIAAYRDLRNTLTHRSGYVRPGVGAAGYEPWILKRLTAAGLPASFAGKLPVYDADFDDLVRLVRGFVLWVDQARP